VCRETCTELPGQINICYSLAPDALLNISSSALDEAYSSLSSAQPSASSFSFDPQALIAQTQASTHTSTQTSTQTTSTQTSRPPTTSPPTPIPHPSNSLSGGAIAGIVIGAIGGIALACLAAFLLLRRRKRRQNGLAHAAIPQDEPKYIIPAQEYKHDPGYDMPKEMHADTRPVAELHGGMPHEMEGGAPRAEMPGDRGR
jgi:hypothetical protein